SAVNSPVAYLSATRCTLTSNGPGSVSMTRVSSATDTHPWPPRHLVAPLRHVRHWWHLLASRSVSCTHLQLSDALQQLLDRIGQRLTPPLALRPAGGDRPDGVPATDVLRPPGQPDYVAALPELVAPFRGLDQRQG